MNIDGALDAQVQRSEAATVAAKPGELYVSALLRRQAFTLEVSLHAQPGEILAVLGPNGAGKSTLLAVLAGLLVPDDGEVVLGGTTLTGHGVLIPPERRGVGLMGQDPLLFPHLSAAENIAFGPRSQGVPKVEARADAMLWLERMGLADLARRRPAQLSGGQRQRVALARALAARPALLLLDEPLGALDAATAPEVRQVLRTHIRAAGVTTLIVTHGILDAVTLSDQVLVLADGAVVDRGPTAAVLSAPRSPFTAALAGLNLVPGVVSAAVSAGESASVRATAINGDNPPGLVSDHGRADGGAATMLRGIAAEPLAEGAAAMALFAPAAVAVYLENPGVGSPRNMWSAVVTALEPGPTSIRVRALIGADGTGPSIAADLTPAAVAALNLEPGMGVHLAVKASEVRVHGSAASGS